MLKDGDPNGRNVGTADGVRLTDDALLLRALVHFPSRSRLIDTGSAARVEVGPGIAVLVGEAMRNGGSPGDHRGGRKGGRDGILVLVLPKVQAEPREGWVNFENGVGRHCRRESEKRNRDQ